MKPTALLINTARGGLVDEAALIRALEEGWIGGAGFDVLTVEPPTGGHPLLEVRRPNFILTPHVAWASQEAIQSLADQLVDNIEALMETASFFTKVSAPKARGIAVLASSGGAAIMAAEPIRNSGR